MLDLTSKQHQIANLIDQHVNRFPETTFGDEQLLPTLFDYMPGFKQVMDSSSSVQMDFLCTQYPGFYRFAMIMEAMAKGISNGEIPRN